MKKKIWLIGVIVVLVLLLVGCESLFEPLDNDTNNQEKIDSYLAKKPPKPEKTKTVIEELTIDGIPFVIGDEVQYPDPEDLDSHPLIDLSDGSDIYYRVTSTVDISFVRLNLYYDTNCNSDRYVHEDGDDYKIEAWSWIFQISNSGSTTAEETVAWTGDVIPLALDAIVYNSNPYHLFDELATYNYQTGEPWLHPYDHYLLKLDVHSEDGTLLASKRMYCWITSAEDRSATRYFVQDISLDYTVNKNKATPIATVKISKIMDDVITPAQGVYIDGDWGGFITASFEYCMGGPSDADGMITITGPAFRKNQSGIWSYSVSTIRAQTGVYDPWENTLGNPAWVWPDTKPVCEIVW